MNHNSRIKNLMCLILVLCCFIPSGCSEDKSKSEPNSNNSSSVSESRRPSEILNYDDDFTLLIYMCGSSLESKNGSASDDISELLSADIPKKVNGKNTGFPPINFKDIRFRITSWSLLKKISFPVWVIHQR